MAEPWHVPAESIGDYLADRVDQPTASSLESHLLGCATCRNALAQASDAELTRYSWSAIEQSVDGEFGSPMQRAASRAGVPDQEIRTLVPTLSLRLTWVASTFLVLLSAALLARSSVGSGESLARLAFLTLAPLAPLVAVVAALGAVSEPAPEIARVTSASRLRIGAIRAMTVMLAAITAGLLASVVLPGSWLEAVAWLLPALALSGAGALVAGRLPFSSVIGWLGSAWVVAVAVAARLTDDRLAAFRPGVQWLYLTIALVAVLAIAVRPDSLDLRSNT